MGGREPRARHRDGALREGRRERRPRLAERPVRRALAVALSPDAIFVNATGSAIHAYPLTASAVQPGWTDLAPTLAELRRTLGPRTAVLQVALLPPLVQLRRVELPRLTEDEARAVLSRDAHRYLLDPPRAPLAAAWSRAAGKPQASWLAIFAEADLVAAIHDAAAASGFGEARVMAAHGAWEAAARRYVPEVKAGVGRLIVAGGGQDRKSVG